MIIYTTRVSKNDFKYTCIIVREEGHPDVYIFDSNLVYSLVRTFGVNRKPDLNEEIVLYNGFTE